VGDSILSFLQGFVHCTWFILHPKLCRLRLKCDGTRAETRFRLSAKQTSLFKSTRSSVQSTTGSRDVPVSGSNAGYTMFRGSVKSTGYPLHSPVSLSLPLPCVTVCLHISTGLYLLMSSLYPFCLPTVLLHPSVFLQVLSPFVFLPGSHFRILCSQHVDINS